MTELKTVHPSRTRRRRVARLVDLLGLGLVAAMLVTGAGCGDDDSKPAADAGGGRGGQVGGGGAGGSVGGQGGTGGSGQGGSGGSGQDGGGGAGGAPGAGGSGGSDAAGEGGGDTAENDAPAPVDASDAADVAADVGGSDSAADVATDTGTDAGTDAVPPGCGGPGQPCCRGRTCKDNGCCLLGPGSNTARCQAAGTACGSGFAGTCEAGSCGPAGTKCGGVGQPCCPVTGGATRCTASGTSCRNAVCAACGAPGQPCCRSGLDDDEVCLAGSTCSTGSAGTGSCQTCGGADQPCCVGETACQAALTCSGTGIARRCRAATDAGTDSGTDVGTD